MSFIGFVNKQKQIIENVELGVYSNGIRSAYIPNKEKPRIPDKSDTKFLSKALNKIKLNSTSKDFYHQEEEEDEQVDEELVENDANVYARRSTLKNEESRSGSQGSKKKGPDYITNTEGVRKETIDQLIAERDKFRTMYQAEVKKNNNSKIVIESQKRLIDRTKIESMSRKAGGYDMMRPHTQYNRFK